MNTLAWLVVLVLVATTSSVLTLAIASRRAADIGRTVARERLAEVWVAGWHSGARAVQRALIAHPLPEMTTVPEQGYRRAHSELIGVAAAVDVQGPPTRDEPRAAAV